MATKEETINKEDMISFIKSKLIITEQLMNEDTGSDYGHSQFLSGLQNAYDDILFEVEHGDITKTNTHSNDDN